MYKLQKNMLFNATEFIPNWDCDRKLSSSPWVFL